MNKTKFYLTVILIIVAYNLLTLILFDVLTNFKFQINNYLEWVLFLIVPIFIAIIMFLILNKLANLEYQKSSNVK